MYSTAIAIHNLLISKWFFSSWNAMWECNRYLNISSIHDGCRQNSILIDVAYIFHSLLWSNINFECPRKEATINVQLLTPILSIKNANIWSMFWLNNSTTFFSELHIWYLPAWKIYYCSFVFTETCNLSNHTHIFERLWNSLPLHISHCLAKAGEKGKTL